VSAVAPGKPTEVWQLSHLPQHVWGRDTKEFIQCSPVGFDPVPNCSRFILTIEEAPTVSDEWEDFDGNILAAP